MAHFFGVGSAGNGINHASSAGALACVCSGGAVRGGAWEAVTAMLLWWGVAQLGRASEAAGQGTQCGEEEEALRMIAMVGLVLLMMVLQPDAEGRP